MKVTKTSCVSGKQNTMELDVTMIQLHLWQSGELIQKAMPNLSLTEREFLITGMSPEEQEEFYNKLEE